MSVVAVLIGDSRGPGEVSVSVSEPDDSRSQLSATGLDLGLCRGFWGTVVESLRCERVAAISEAMLVVCSWAGCGDVCGWRTRFAGRFPDGVCS